MKRIMLSVIAVTAISLFALFGCSNNGFENSTGGGKNESVGQEEIPYTVIYYSANDNKKVTIEESFSGAPEFIMTHLISRISEFCEVSIDCNSVNEDAEAGNITIDFAAGKSPVSGLSSGSESAVLDSITETVFANLPYINNVYFTCDGKEYNSGHVSLEVGEAYRSRPVEEQEEKKGPIVDRPEFNDNEQQGK